MRDSDGQYDHAERARLCGDLASAWRSIQRSAKVCLKSTRESAILADAGLWVGDAY